MINKPMIYDPLSTLMLSRIREILIISTPQDIPKFEELFGDGSRLDLSFDYEVQEAPNGVIVKQLIKFVDERGYLIETFRFDILPEGLNPQMSYVSYTEHGVSRGPHEHRDQTNIFAFI